MQLRVSNPALVPELLEFLQSRLDAVAHQLSEDVVEVSLLGSYAEDAIRMEVFLRVRAWEAARRSSGVTVDIVD
jgi:hypothetical protein